MTDRDGRGSDADIKPVHEISSRVQRRMGQSPEGRKRLTAPAHGPTRTAPPQLTFAKAEFTVLAEGEVVNRREPPIDPPHTSTASLRSA